MARTFAVLGASNTGKSTLVDRMCGLEGQPQPAAPPGELRVAGFTHLGDDWQAIDCPGSIELLHVAADALLAADIAVVCVGADPAAAALASPYLHLVEAAGIPAIVFINRIDEAQGRVRDIVAALQDFAATRSSCARSRSSRTATSPARSTSSPSAPGTTARASRRSSSRSRPGSPRASTRRGARCWSTSRSSTTGCSRS